MDETGSGHPVAGIPRVQTGQLLSSDGGVNALVSGTGNDHSKDFINDSKIHELGPFTRSKLMQLCIVNRQV